MPDYQALYRKWRPAVFSDVIGQAHITDTLTAQIKTGHVSHAYLFTGTRGTGKTTCAKILARAVNCENPKDGNPCNVCPACLSILSDSATDVLEIDAASNNGVENIRNIREEAYYSPAVLKKRVYIIDEVHMLSSGAFNALLKTLEEPPSYVLFILATTELHKVPATILSRCQRFDFKRIAPAEISRRLMDVAAKEGALLSTEAADVIAGLADGSMRDGLSVLDRIASSGGPIDAGNVYKTLGLAERENVLSIMTAISSGDLKEALSSFSSLYNSGRNLNSILDELLSLSRDLLIIKTDDSRAAGFLKKYRDAAAALSINELISIASSIQDTLVKTPRGALGRAAAEICIASLACRAEAENPRTRSAEAEKQAETRPEPPAHLINSPILESEESPVPQNGGDAALWKQVVASVHGKINSAAYTHLKNFAAAAVDGSKITVSADDMTLMVISTPAVKAEISSAAEKVFGRAMALAFKTE